MQIYRGYFKSTTIVESSHAVLTQKSVRVSKLYLPKEQTAPLESTVDTSWWRFCDGKLDFKNSGCVAGGSCGTGPSPLTSHPTSTSGQQQQYCTNSLSPTNDAASQFNIFPAIFSRQLNFSTANATQAKLMDDLRPNLVGGLLGLQQGLLDDHALAHGNIQHSGHQDSKFMTSFQENRLMGISASHENRLLGLSQDLRAAASMNNLENSKNSSVQHQNSRKCSSTPEDFSALYGGLSASTLGDASSHHHTPAHTPPSRLDHSITGLCGVYTIRHGYFLGGNLEHF